MSKHPGYVYKTVDVANEPEVINDPVWALAKVHDISNHHADQGWRTVSMLLIGGSIWLLLERRKPNPFNQRGSYVENQRWHDWEEQYGEGGVR